MKTATLTPIHPFEKAGLGVAPFTFQFVRENVYVACQGAPPQPGGSCDYCATGIMYEYHLKSHDGKRFKVGCDCVLRLESADNRLISQVERAKMVLDKKKRDEKRKATLTRENARIEAAFARLEDETTRNALIAQPHPSIKDDGHNLLTYVEWMGRNAGHAGRLKAAKLIESI